MQPINYADDRKNDACLDANYNEVLDALPRGIRLIEILLRCNCPSLPFLDSKRMQAFRWLRLLTFLAAIKPRHHLMKRAFTYTHRIHPPLFQIHNNPSYLLVVCAIEEGDFDFGLSLLLSCLNLGLSDVSYEKLELGIDTGSEVNRALADQPPVAA